MTMYALMTQAIATPQFSPRHHNNQPRRSSRQPASSPEIPPLIRPQRPQKPAPLPERKATTQRIFETLSHDSDRVEGNPFGLKNYSLKYVLYHRPSGVYFKVDRQQYPQVVSYEQAATHKQKGHKNLHAGRMVFVNGFHQVLHSAVALENKEGRALVRLKGPILWPIPELMEAKADPAVPPPSHQFERSDSQESQDPQYRPWQKMIRRFHSEQRAIKAKQAQEMDIIVEFTSLLPEGYAQELEVFPTEDLPKLWSQTRLNLDA